MRHSLVRKPHAPPGYSRNQPLVVRIREHLAAARPLRRGEESHYISIDVDVLMQ